MLCFILLPYCFIFTFAVDNSEVRYFRGGFIIIEPSWSRNPLFRWNNHLKTWEHLLKLWVQLMVIYCIDRFWRSSLILQSTQFEVGRCYCENQTTHSYFHYKIFGFVMIRSMILGNLSLAKLLIMFPILNSVSICWM